MSKYIIEYNGVQFMDKIGREKIKELQEQIEQSSISSAANINIVDENNNFNTTNVEGALNELFQFASNGKQLIANAITGKGVSASNTDTFEQLANKIGTISGNGNIFNITNNLTHATNSNTKTTIEEYNSYKATITIENNYKLDSISITMGGINITSTCYSNGEIHIEDVIGHLVVTVIAVENTTPTVTLNWNFANQIAGNGSGDIQLTINDDSLVGNYDIYYGDDNGKLSNYDKICTLSAIKDITKSYSYFNDFQLIPTSATKLVAIKDNATKGEFNIPTNKRFTNTTYGNKLYSFGAISDIHLSVETAESDFQTALTYLDNNETVVFTCVSGDVADNGTEEQLTTYKNIVTQYSPNTPVYATNGNHELRNTNFTNDFWRTYVERDKDFIIKYMNDVFIFLGIENPSTAGAKTYSETQKAWLEEQLNAYSDVRVFLFTHPYIYGTGNGNYNDYYNLNILTTTNTCGKWLFNLMKQYTNVILCTGHSHLKFIVQELAKDITICNKVDDVQTAYMLHIPSISVPRDVMNGAITDLLYAQSEGVVIDVYEHGILYRGRNFVDGKFIPIGQFMLPIEQGTLPSSYTITNNLSNATNSNTSISIADGAIYQATITANNNYIIESVTVTMGGIDITSTVYNNGTINISSVTGNIIITVITKSSLVPCTGITLNNTSLTFTNTNSNPQTLIATLTPSNTTDIITWESNDVAVATVSNGVVTPKSVENKTCTITAKCGNQTATCTVTVNISEYTVLSTNWELGTISSSTGEDEEWSLSSNNSARTSYIPFDTNSHSYHLTLTAPAYGSSDTDIKTISIYVYDENKNFVARCAGTSGNYFNNMTSRFNVTSYISAEATKGYLRVRVSRNSKTNTICSDEWNRCVFEEK